MTNRAYSLLTVKDIDDDERVIRGIASTPSPDRMQDIVVPKGGVFKLPLPLLWQHNASEPIGHVTEAKVTKAGIEIVARIAKGVSAAIDERWKLIRAGLVQGLSIGFRGLETEQIPNSWGVKFLRWELLEISSVTIPANSEATITSVKKYDHVARKAAPAAKKKARIVKVHGHRVVKLSANEMPRPGRSTRVVRGVRPSRVVRLGDGR